MPERFRLFFARHPVLREAMLWAIPALVVGAALRLLLLSYLPYAFWGADSRSYYSFAHMLLSDVYISLDEKRRYLYPLLLAPISLLPGPPLRWLALLQHMLGVATLVPLAYIVRKTFVHWRLWIVPVTALFSLLPIVVWYEHELLGETVFFAALLWAFAGWCAWVSESRVQRAGRLFWGFFVPFALFILTKPSGRFVWPGVLVGMVFIAGWRRLDRRQVVALFLLMGVTLTVGSKKQAAWLLYTSVFPLTQIETPLYADYKAEICDLVEPLHAQVDSYAYLDDVPFAFLERPGDHPDRPLWAALEKDPRRRAAVYMALALEAIKAHPVQFLHLGLQRVVASADLSSFGRERFTSEYVLERTERSYQGAAKDEKSSMRRAFALPLGQPLPPFPKLGMKIAPAPSSWRERVVLTVMNSVGDALDFCRSPRVPKEQRTLRLTRPTFLGCWLLLGAALSFLPRYRSTLGVWTLVAVAYLGGVFLVSQLNPRYFAPVWPMLVVLFAVPADVLVQLFFRGRKRAG